MKKISVRWFVPIAGILLVLDIACTTQSLLPDGILADPTGNNANGEPVECPEGIVSFQHEILPLIVSGCAQSGCHDAITREYGIQLDSYETIVKEVKPGDPKDSELYEVLVETDPDEIMPPPPLDPFTPEQIALVKAWIEQGAQETICGTPCDPSLASFTEQIYPMMKTYCIGCHNDNSAGGDVNLNNYELIKASAQDGSLLGSIKHEASYSAMPPGSGSMNDCQIAQIQKWIDEGTLNN